MFRAVRAMNEALKQGRFRSKEQDPSAGISSSEVRPLNSRQGSGEVGSFSQVITLQWS